MAIDYEITDLMRKQNELNDIEIPINELGKDAPTYKKITRIIELNCHKLTNPTDDCKYVYTVTVLPEDNKLYEPMLLISAEEYQNLKSLLSDFAKEYEIPEETNSKVVTDTTEKDKYSAYTITTYQFFTYYQKELRYFK
ncbi:MAG: hypothetical protein [Bacteriophage sp.]|nr:MAG: hypothetical protein [Bacteriophage sp.]